MSPALAITFNALGLYGIAFVLTTAFATQLWLGELPCPLCLLQRIAFAMLAIGPMLNIRFGPRPSHYALSLLAAVAGAGFAMRQILLHIMPGDPGYGTALLGYHYYTWAFVGFAIAIVLIATMLLCDTQFARDASTPAAASAFGRTAVSLVIVLTALNVASTLMRLRIVPGQSDAIRNAQARTMTPQAVRIATDAA